MLSHLPLALVAGFAALTAMLWLGGTLCTDGLLAHASQVSRTRWLAFLVTIGLGIATFVEVAQTRTALPSPHPLLLTAFLASSGLYLGGKSIRAALPSRTIAFVARFVMRAINQSGGKL